MAQYRITTNGSHFRIESLKKRWFINKWRWVPCHYWIWDPMGGTKIPAIFATIDEAKEFVNELKTEERPWVEVK